MLYSIKCVMYANASVGSFFFHITLGSHELAWINFMFFKLSELYFWLNRDDEHFPANMQHMLPSKRAILDATYVPIQRPTHRNAQVVAF